MNTAGDLNEKLIIGMTKKLLTIEEELRQKVKLAKTRDQEMLKKVHVRYFKYYKHWKDFDLLTTILAMIGLILAVQEVRPPILYLTIRFIV
jgi:hypothetical protein